MENQASEVERYMAKLEHPMKQEIEALRMIVKDANGGVSEHIKWNAPSFCYGGDDRITFKLYPTDRVQIVFHRGVKAKEDQPFAFTDESGLLKWAATNRGVVTFYNLEDVEAKKEALRDLVRRWVEATA